MTGSRILCLAAALYVPVLTIVTAKVQSASDVQNHTDEKVLRITENRPCGAPTKRQYLARHRGIGFEILDSESEACFVPDQEYRLLDDLIDSVLARTRYDDTIKTTEARRQQ